MKNISLEKAFGLTELMIGMLLTLFLLAGTYKILASQTENTKTAMQLSILKKQLIQSKRVLTEDIQFAGYNAFEEAIFFANETRLKVWSDTKTTTKEVSLGEFEEHYGYIDEGEAVEFKYEDGTLFKKPVLADPEKLVTSIMIDNRDADFPSNPDQARWTPLAKNVSEFRFEYDGQTSVPISKYKSVKNVRVVYSTHLGGRTLQEGIEAGTSHGRTRPGTSTSEYFTIRLANR